MASMSDGRARQGIIFSCMKQPSLVKQLKGILSEYPDGGQILKELIQNAEDADASDVKILYDSRRINNDTSESAPTFNKFFKGPALCVYNNAVFSEEDWEGIQMIYSSKKEHNPLKVGRFGLGFKSVFHLTDYPSVLSGHKLLMIDPQQPRDMVNALIDLSEIETLAEVGLNYEAFKVAFEDTFGLRMEHVQHGYFNGTLFWFPLREAVSSISETLYNDDKIKSLFQGFEGEASSILIFLKNLESISMWTRGGDRLLREYSKVAIYDTYGLVKQKRSEFKENIISFQQMSEPVDLHNDIFMTVDVSSNGTNKRHEWLVVNYFVGKSGSRDFMALINDEKLCYSPYVGVATPLNVHFEHQEGHVFCFLPLPKEGCRSTGLPVHVNGFFALSQNRHHLKWPTEEQDDCKIDDKSILWNKYLLREALPLAYCQLIKVLIDKSIKLGNTHESVTNTYSCLPVSENTHVRWSVLEKGLYEKLSKTCFLYSLNKETWVSLKDAFFATFSNMPESYTFVKDAVIRGMSCIGKCYVNVTTNLFSTIQKYVPEAEDLSPAKAVIYLLETHQYKNINDEDKLKILAYILSDCGSYESLEGLELLPMASGEWTRFDKNEHPVFVCSESVCQILFESRWRLLRKCSEPLCKSLERIHSKGLYQLKELLPSDFKDLLEYTLDTLKGCKMTHSTYFTIEWLHVVWKFIINSEGYELNLFSELQLVPVLLDGTWLQPLSLNLVKLSDLLLVQTYDGETLSDAICDSFKMMNVTVLRSLPDWMVPFHELKRFFYLPNRKGVIDLLSKINARENSSKTTAIFNRSSCSIFKHELRDFIKGCQFEVSQDTGARNIVKQLNLFYIVSHMNGASEDNFGSVSECQEYINGTECFPKNVAFPFRCLLVDSSCNELMCYLGARKVKLNEMVNGVLKQFEKYGDCLYVFMDFFLKNFHLFRNNPATINAARDVPFLLTSKESNSARYKACELFDPTNSKIQTLLYDEFLTPEIKEPLNDEIIDSLRAIGMQDSSCVDAEILFKVAKTLDEWAEKKLKDINYKKKSVSFMKHLTGHPHVLDELCADGQNLRTHLASLSCICVQKLSTEPYPKCIPWYEHDKELCRPTEVIDIQQCLLVGASMPIVVCKSDKLCESFQWNKSPPFEKILEQLRIIRDCFSVQNKSEVMPSIKNIFEHMCKHLNYAEEYKLNFRNQKLMWTGEEFVSAERIIIISNKDDIDLRPYFFSLSSEYNRFHALFEAIDCKSKQDESVLLNVLKYIKDEHCIAQAEQIVKRDRLIVNNVLTKLAGMKQEDEHLINQSELLIMVRDSNINSLQLHPVSKCTYDDDPNSFSELDDNIYLVHEMIPHSVAEELGVHSITKKAVLDAVELGVEECGQKERLTTRIHTLLRDGYTDGLSVPKELIQNADDAGASEVRFLYDERLNRESKERVLSKGMRGFQGPALWVYNDRMFTKDDLSNITKLNEGTKLEDSKKIGKFGLGFCSVYNITDLPSFITGSDIVFFDPHEKYLGNKKGTGLKYTLHNQTLVKRHLDQFKPYQGIFDCNVINFPSNGYQGTLFRLPLRTDDQAKVSEIFSQSYTHDDMLNLLQLTINAAGNMLLFTQNVRKIQIYHLAENARDSTIPDFVFGIERNILDADRMTHSLGPILPRIPDLIKTNVTFKEIHAYSFEQIISEHCEALIGEDNLQSNSKTNWIVSWATGTKHSLEMYNEQKSDNALPVAAVAVPYSNEKELTFSCLDSTDKHFYRSGHVFCFLPLPLETGLPVHINGCFSVTSDRRQFVSVTDDDKDKSRKKWNDAIMEDSLVNAYFNLLESVRPNDLECNFKYYDLWPMKGKKAVFSLKNAFYKYIVTTNPIVFCVRGTWLAFKDVIYLDPTLRQGPLGDIMFRFVSCFTIRPNEVVIEMPDLVLENLKNSNQDMLEYIESKIIDEREISLIVLRNIDHEFWLDKFDMRNQLVKYALDLSDEIVNKVIKMTSCIPTLPSNKLRKPSEVINPHCTIANLFNVNDERFPIKNHGFREDQTLNRLIENGMITKYLPHDLLLDRCVSISEAATSCCICVFDRCRKLFNYMSNETVLERLEKDKNILDSISSIDMFPILPKPNKWAFSWKANERQKDMKTCSKNHDIAIKHRFGKAKDLFRQTLCDFVGTVECIVDESIFGNDISINEHIISIFKIKEIRDTNLITMIMQMETISAEYKNPRSQYYELKRIHNVLFQQFEKYLKNEYYPGKDIHVIERLNKVPVVLVHRKLVKTCNVAFHAKAEFPPVLYIVPEFAKEHFNSVYKVLGIKSHFDIDNIIEAFNFLKEAWSRDKEKDIENANALLQNLQYSMESSNLTFDSISDKHDMIYAPDVLHRLILTKDLVIENKEFITTDSMNILHHGIVPSVAHFLGVTTKQTRCFDDISKGIPFGQNEKLGTRIRGLLDAYPCDSSIMSELLQNADDAGATEINFIKDYRNHSTKRLFSDSCQTLQGPSLCVYNNSFFTEKDIEGIHNLGQGSKHQDPSKTGQYGVGFNAVYHLTDTPSFLTKRPEDLDGGLLVFLDPLCKHVPKASPAEPGQMVTFNGVQTNFPDHLLGFSSDILIKNRKGTIFRFPLRSEKSEISNTIVDIERMNNILLSFKADMYDSLLFLKNICCIKISNITSGKYCEEYSVHVSLEEEEKRKQLNFNSKVREIVKQNENDKILNLKANAFETVYKMTISDSCEMSKKWMIVQKFGFETMTDAEIIMKKMIGGEIGQLPVGGVALPLNENNGSASTKDIPINARVFCFLPLPLQSGFPLHVNGHFALDHEARRNIGKEGHKQKWNHCIALNNIIPTWITGIFQIQTDIETGVRHAKTWNEVRDILDSYHYFFPVPNKTYEKFWNDLIHDFYKVVIDGKKKLFPCILDAKCAFTPPAQYLKRPVLRFDILWCYMSNDSVYDFDSGVFNDIQNYQSVSLSTTKSKLLENMLKSFGLKLVSTPSKIWNCIKTFGNLRIPISTPHLVIDYLKNDMIANVDTDICKTKYISPLNLKELIVFLQRDKAFFQRIHGLPILLTADSVLRYFSNEYPVYVSEFAQLLPLSARFFIHAEILDLFQDKNAIKTNCFMYLSMNDFVEMLPENKDNCTFAQRKEVKLSINMCNDRKNISHDWLCMLYDFLVSESLAKVHENTYVPSENILLETNHMLNFATFIENLEALGNWSFLPCDIQSIAIENDARPSLIALSDAPYVIHLHEHSLQEEVRKSFQRLGLPQLCVKTFMKCRYADCLTRVMQRRVASLLSPCLIFECLVHHHEHINSVPLTPYDAINILSYFDGHLSALTTNIEEKQLQRKLKLLPLFLTQQNSLTSVMNKQQVIVLPKEIPPDGVQEWADSCNKTLLKMNSSVLSLYKFLRFTISDMYTVYAETIIPTFHSMPKDYWMIHIDFLRQKIINKKARSIKEQCIIEQLKRIPFISVGSEMKQARELYSPQNDVFALMLDEGCFPPRSFLSNQWYFFLTLLDLKTNVDDTMLLRFALEIERFGVHRINSDIENKSKTLFKCFQSNKGIVWQEKTLDKLKTVRFILPYKVPNVQKLIFRQFDEGQNLIHFENTISDKQQLLCWTSMSLMSNDMYESLDDRVRRTLHIHQCPPLEKVILHCQNVCDRFKGLLKSRDNGIDKDFIEQQMTKIYKYLAKNGQSGDTLKSRLSTTPIIYLPDDGDIVTINDVVIELPNYNQVKPYLYAAPVYYGKYFDLFKYLGCKQIVGIDHYARVLETLKNETKGKPMMLKELNIARKAIEHLFTPSYMQNADNCKRLYLPSRDMVLMSAKDLVVSDRYSYERRLSGNCQITYFSGFQNLKIQLRCSETDAICNVPKHLRPVLLSEITTEEICLDSMEEIGNSLKAAKVETFLHSDHLLNGLSRLLKFQSQTKDKQYSDKWFEELNLQLKGIKVCEVKDLKTVLYFKKLLIPNTDKELYFYIKSNDQKKVFYFKDDINSKKLVLNKLIPGLTKLILSCSSGLGDKSVLIITQMLQEIENPMNIQSVLDDLGIDQFDVPIAEMRDHFPKPGTAVDKIFFPFLEQGIYPFKDYEFESVVLDLDDTAKDKYSNRDPVYIYVHIIRDLSPPNCSNLSHIYLVDTGNPDIQEETIPIYRLFRFVRQKEDVGNVMDRCDGEPIFAFPVDENCRRIREELLEAWQLSEEDKKRVIRRLYLKWYPDRNLVNRDYCSEVFNYIKIVLSRLENEEVPATNVRTDIVRGPSNMSLSSFYYTNITTRAKAYVQAYNDNIQEYRHSYKNRQGLFCHVPVQRSKRQDITEAKRWFRQAKCDFLAAKSFAMVAEDVDGFNWICYTCHQSCEKALKSTYYARDADNVPRGSSSHRLSLLALDDDMRKQGQICAECEQATLMEDKFGDNSRLRYPDALSRPNIPSDLFKKEDADFAIKTTGTLLNLVEEFIT